MNINNFNLVHLESVESTNLHASDLLSVKKINSPTVILADYQTGGKGQGNNTWESNASDNLLFSVVVFPDKMKSDKQYYLSKIASLSVHELLSSEFQDIKIKWPNDILARKTKISGILIENVVRGNLLFSSVIGIGINVNQENFSVPASSMKILSGKEYDRFKLLTAFLDIFSKWHENLSARRFRDIDEIYLSNLYGFHEWMRFSWQGIPFEGLIEDVEEDGYLVMSTRDKKILKFGFREVDFIGET